MAEANWETLDGNSDMDILDLPIDRFCNRVMAWARSVIPAKEWPGFVFRMELPPIGTQPTTGPWSESEMTATWSRS